MDTRNVAQTILSLEKPALEAFLNGNPTPYLDLYSKDITYFDSVHELRLDGWDRVKELYENVRGKMSTVRFQMLNPLIQTSGNMAVLSYNVESYIGETRWMENCTEVYTLNEEGKWEIVHSHWSAVK